MEDFGSILICLGAFIGIPYLINLCMTYKEKLDKAEKLISHHKSIDEREREVNQKLRKNEETWERNVKIREDINTIIQDNTQECEWLAERISEYNEMADTKIETFLKNKKNPAYKASDIVSEIKKEKRELIRENKKLQYQLAFLKSNFPMLEDAMQLTPEDIKDAVNTIYNLKEDVDEYEVLKEYLNPQEYAKLSTAEKYQLALDRYQSKKKKSLWQIGISYERYIGYIYENKNYNVIYNGALEGRGDLGRDIIAENNEEILIIQCKYWRKESIIHEKAIFQLYGTMILQQLQTKKKVKGILVTTTQISDTAKKVAQHLNIQTRENEIFDKTYPCIKCNINRANGEKIYHLPFDQQYDRIKIDINKGEKYVATVKEAEQLGFRRAKKHMYVNR